MHDLVKMRMRQNKHKYIRINCSFIDLPSLVSIHLCLTLCGDYLNYPQSDISADISNSQLSTPPQYNNTLIMKSMYLVGIFQDVTEFTCLGE